MNRTWGGVPKVRGTFLGVPRIRIIVFLGSILGSLYFGKPPYVEYGFSKALHTHYGGIY